MIFFPARLREFVPAKVNIPLLRKRCRPDAPFPAARLVTGGYADYLRDGSATRSIR